MTWYSQYIGVPFRDHGRTPAGWDCWGLVHWCLARHFGLATPDYLDRYCDVRDKDSIASTIEQEKVQWLPVAHPRPGDVVSMRRRGVPYHVGLVVSHRDVLHVTEKTGTILEDFIDPNFGLSILGFYRHAAAR